MSASFSPGPSHQPPLRGLAIEFRDIEKRYGPRLALRGISLEIGAGECVALVGANGSGKTTLLRVAALLVRPTRGQVQFPGMEGADGAALVRRRIALVAHQTLLYDELTAEENLLLFAQLYGLGGAAAQARQALELAGLGGRERDMVRTFSRGMRQRLTIARALLPRPALLLLDEPSTGLDPAGQQWLAATLARLRGDGCTILMSTHAASDAAAVATRAVLLEAGSVAEDSGASGDAGALLRSALGTSLEGRALGGGALGGEEERRWR